MKNKLKLLIIIFVYSLIFFNVNNHSYASELPIGVENSNLIWGKKNLAIYIENNKETIEKIFLEWNEKSGHLFNFSFISDKNKSDISVVFIKENLSGYGAYTTYFHNNNTILKTIIALPQKSFSNDNINSSINIFVIKHEIGHCLGIFKHSKDKKDIMFPTKTDQNNDITKNDIKNLKKIYLKKNKKIIEFNKISGEYKYDLPYLANIYKKRGKYDKAIEIYNEILENNPDFTPAIYSIGYCWFKEKDYKKSELYLKSAYKKEPNNIIYLNSYIKILYKLNKIDLAYNVLNKYIAENPKEAENYLIKDLFNILNKSNFKD